MLLFPRGQAFPRNSGRRFAFRTFSKSKEPRFLQSSASTRIARRVKPVTSHRVNITQSANRTSFDDLNAALGLVVGQVGGRGVRPEPPNSIIVMVALVVIGLDGVCTAGAYLPAYLYSGWYFGVRGHTRWRWLYEGRSGYWIVRPTPPSWRLADCDWSDPDLGMLPM
jgi:hypothetical protein